MRTSGEAAVDAIFCVTRSTLAECRVSEAEARGAAELVIPLEVKEARLAAVTLAAFHVGLAAANPGAGVTRRGTLRAASHAAPARPSTEIDETQNQFTESTPGPHFYSI